MDEQALLDRVRGLLGPVTADGWGLDADAGLVPGAGGLVASVDTVTQARHLPRGAGYDALGWHGVAASLSDLAAAGARPLGVLLAVLAPGKDPRPVEGMVRGAAACLADHGVGVIGGDTKPGTEATLSVTALGRLEGPGLTRVGARPGDALVMTGAAGKAWPLVHARQPGRWTEQVDRGLRVRARLAEGAWLARHGARACADTSDGLLEAAWLLTGDRDLGATLDLAAVPLMQGVPEAHRTEAVAFGGDYELVAAIPTARVEGLLEDWPFETAFTVVGQVTDDAGTVVDRDGEALPRGYGTRWATGPPVTRSANRGP